MTKTLKILLAVLGISLFIFYAILMRLAKQVVPDYPAPVYPMLHPIASSSPLRNMPAMPGKG